MTKFEKDNAAGGMPVYRPTNPTTMPIVQAPKEFCGTMPAIPGELLMEMRGAIKGGASPVNQGSQQPPKTVPNVQTPSSCSVNSK
jgi:hypothetical protein